MVSMAFQQRSGTNKRDIEHGSESNIPLMDKEATKVDAVERRPQEDDVRRKACQRQICCQHNVIPSVLQSSSTRK